MAIRDEIKHQQSKLKGKGVKAHISYFLTYYTWATIGVICIVIGIVILLRTVLSSRNQVLGVMFLNASTMSVGTNDYGESLEAGFAAYAGIDTDHDEIVIDTSSYQTPGIIVDSYDMSTSQKVSVQAAAGTLDCVVADASNYYHYTCSLAFSDLREVMSDEELARYEEYIYYVDLADVNAYQEQVESAESTDGVMTQEEGETYEKVDSFVRPDPDTMEDPIPVGILVTDAPKVAQSGVYTDRVAIYGFVQSSSQTENAVAFLDYLWTE